MKRIAYTHVMGGYGTVTLVSTESQVGDWIVGELRKLIPKIQISRERQFRSDDTCHYSIERLSGKEHAKVTMWIVKQLLLKGWEPFAADSYCSVHLRSVVEQEPTP